MAKKFPLHPKHPERICWGCDKYCPTDQLRCGNGSGRTQHPAELLGEDWYTWGDWDLAEAPLSFEVYRLDTNVKVWSSIDCTTPRDQDEVELRPGVPEPRQIDWTGRRSAE